jgi:cytochrome c553
MSIITSAALALMLTLAAPAALAELAAPEGDPERGAELAPLCTSCHGPDGRSNLSRYPSIAGLEPERFRERMVALQAGERGHLLRRMTRDLSEQDIADLAAHFATLE